MVFNVVLIFRICKQSTYVNVVRYGVVDKGFHNISQRNVSFPENSRRFKYRSDAVLKKMEDSKSKQMRRKPIFVLNAATTTTCSSTGNDRDHSYRCYQHERGREHVLITATQPCHFVRSNLV